MHSEIKKVAVTLIGDKVFFDFARCIKSLHGLSCLTDLSRFKQRPGYRACLGILNLAKKYGKTRLENACLRAEKIGGLHYKHLASILQTRLDKLPAEPDKQQTLPSTHANVRGADYYH